MAVSAALAVVLARFAWQHRRVPGAAPFSLAALLVAAWSLAAAAEAVSATLPAKLLWNSVQYLARALLPVLWLLLAAEHTGFSLPRLRRVLPWLSVLPVVTLALVFTNDWHGLIAADVRFDTGGPLPVLVRSPGAWHWIHALYSGLLLAISALLLLRDAARDPARSRAPALLAALLLPLAWAGVYWLRPWSTPVADLAPVAATLAGVVALWALFGARPFGVSPVARDRVLESLADPVVVLDSRGRVADFNPAAAETLGWTRRAALNRPAGEALAAWPALAAACAGQAPPPAELALDGPAGPRHFDLRLSVLAEPHGRPLGQLVMLHDVTRRKQLEDDLRCLAVTDALTGLPNRRRFFEALADEVRRARRYQTPLALVLLDVDDFKRLNDTFGHPAGDVALAALAATLRQAARASDLPSRQGGDEFAVLLPHTGRIGAEAAARRLRDAARAVVDPGGQPLSLSMGIAELDPDPPPGANPAAEGDALLARADQALHAAKRTGSGAIVVAEVEAGDWKLEA